MSEKFIFLIALVGSITLTWASFVYIWPAVARIKMIDLLEAVRDECEDAITAGYLPRDECTRELTSNCQAFIDSAKRISLSSIFAMRLAIDPSALRNSLPEPPSFAKLTAPQRRYMHQLEHRITEAVADFLINGSRIWWLLRPAIWVGRHLRGGGTVESRTTARLVVDRSVEPEWAAGDLQRLARRGPFSVRAGAGPLGGFRF